MNAQKTVVINSHCCSNCNSCLASAAAKMLCQSSKGIELTYSSKFDTRAIGVNYAPEQTGPVDLTMPKLNTSYLQGPADVEAENWVSEMFPLAKTPRGRPGLQTLADFASKVSDVRSMLSLKKMVCVRMDEEIAAHVSKVMTSEPWETLKTSTRAFGLILPPHLSTGTIEEVFAQRAVHEDSLPRCAELKTAFLAVDDEEPKHSKDESDESSDDDETAEEKSIVTVLSEDSNETEELPSKDMTFYSKQEWVIKRKREEDRLALKMPAKKSKLEKPDAVTVCPVCAKTFPFAQQVKEHMWVRHRISSKTNIKCAKCDKTFPTKMLCEEHEIYDHYH